jgi:hypothetical protein
MSKGNRQNLERLLCSAWERQIVLLAKESTVAMENQKTSSLNVGDSIGLIALIFAGVSVAVTPPFALRIFLLLACPCGFFVFFRKTHWTHTWPEWGQACGTLVATLALASIGIPQLMHSGGLSIQQDNAEI